MKHTTEELILAAHVRDLASKLRAEEHHREATAQMARMEAGADDEPMEQFRARKQRNQMAMDEWARDWYVRHPVAEYTEQALEKLAAVADRLKALKS